MLELDQARQTFSDVNLTLQVADATFVVCELSSKVTVYSCTTGSTVVVSRATVLRSSTVQYCIVVPYTVDSTRSTL